MKRLVIAAAGLGLACSAYAAPACTSGTTLFSFGAGGAGAVGTVYDAQYTQTAPGTPTPPGGNSFSCTLDGITFSNFQLLINAPGDVGADLFLTMSTVNQATGQIVFGTDMSVGQDVQFQYEMTPSISSMTLNNGGSGT